MNKILSFILFAGFALGAGFADTAEADSLVLGTLKGPSGVGLAPMMVNPVTLPDGTGVDIVALGAPDVMVARLVNQEVDAAVLPVNLAAKLYNSGQPIRLALIVGNGMLSVLSNQPGISELTDLGGKTIHVAGQGSTPEFVFRFLLDSAGLEAVQSSGGPVRADQVGLNFSMPYPEIAASLIAGRIDYAVLPEPFSTMTVMKGTNVHRVLDIQELWGAVPGNQADYPMTALVVREEVLNEKPEAVRYLLQAYKKSLDQVLADAEAAGTLVEQSGLGLQAEIASAAIPVTNYVYKNAQESRADIEGLLRVFLNFAPQSIGGKLPDGGFYLR